MEIIEGLKKRVETANDGLTSGLWMKSIIEDNDAYIIDMNTEEQLYEKGINNLGVSIMDYQPYTEFTVEIKQSKGQPTDRVTLKDEGDFYSSFYLQIDDKQFEIKANDIKTADLIKKYGRQILGLTNENIATLIREYILPDLLQKTREVLL